MRIARLRAATFMIAATITPITPSLAENVLKTADGLVTIESWGYQLQGSPPSGELLPEPITAAPHDLVVIDFARFGDMGSRLDLAEVRSIKTRASTGGQRRVAAAYISIGEASEFRSFWNPDWPESRKVRYWEPAWQDLIFNDAGDGWLDTIVSQGFDAAYLDIIDAYFFWGQIATAAEKRVGDPEDAQDAARRMIDFIVDMTAHARQTNPEFFVIPQNGAFILNDSDFAGPLSEDPDRRIAFLDALGAIGVEDVYFGGDLDENNPFNPDITTIEILKRDFLNNGKPVLAVDYLTDPAKTQLFIDTVTEDGFIPYVAPDRDLDTLAPPVPEPTAFVLEGSLCSVFLGRHCRHD